MFGPALALVACLASATATGYIDGREYVYKYTGFVYSGYPRIKPQEAGYSYHVDLRVQPSGDSAIFRVENARKAQFNGEFEDVTRAGHQYEELPAHAEFLTRPFRVHRKNGIVTRFEVSRDEPAFSVNLKRGIVSLFNLNFDPQAEATGAPSTEDNDIQRPDPDPHYYKVYEDSILGDCETAYVIEHHPFHRDHNIVLNVTKVRNFHECRSRPNRVYSVFHGHECGEVDHEKSHTLHGNAHYHYSIRGDRHHYIIEKIRSESEVAFTPYPLEGQTVSTVIKRSLELVAERPVTEPIQVSGDLVQLNSLVYEFDNQKEFREPVDLKKPHYLYHLTGRKAPISDIRHLVEELVQVYSDESYAQDARQRDYPAKFVELLRAVATIGYDEMDDLYRAYADVPEKGASEQQRRHRALFLDTLVNLGTNPAFLYGKHLIETKKLRSGEVVYFLQQLQFHLKEASETLFDQLQELCDNELFRKNPKLHVTCVMTLSNVVFDHCVAHYHPEGLRGGKQHCPPEVTLKYFNYFAKLYEATTNEKMKSYYIKAAANVGVKEILPYVAPYIEGRLNVHRMYRENALWALKNIGYRYPDKVRSLVVPLLFNRTEKHDLRLSAFLLLLMHRPELYEVEGVARAIKHDTDDQVRSFVYATFKAVANSTHICDSRLSKQARYALRILEDVKDEFDEEYDYTYSQHHYFAGYDRDFDFGGSTRLAYYASDSGYIPRAAYLGLEDYIGGKSMHTLGLGFKQFGLERLTDRLFGPEGSFGQRSLFDLFKKRSKRDNNQKELNEIKGKLNLPVHEYEPIMGEIFFKYMGNHLWSYQFDDATFESFFKEGGRFMIPNLPAAYQNVGAFSYQRFMLTVDKFYVMPTESGIPLIFDYKQPVYYFHRNKASSFKVEPGFFPEDRAGQWPQSVKAETDGHFVIDKNLFAYMGVVIPFDQVVFGAGINRRSTLSLPLKLKLHLAVGEKKLGMTWTPVAPHNVYSFKYEPYTFVDSYANAVPMTSEPKYLPVRRVHRHQSEKHFFHDELGLGFDIQTDSENEFNDFGSWVDFLLKKDFRQKFYYLYANPHFEPYRIDVRFSQPTNNPTTEVATELTYQFSADNWVIPHFPEEGFEDFDRQREDRGPVYTCALKGNLVARGTKERKIHAVASWTRDLLRTFHKVNFFYERTPFTTSETEELKVCGSSYLKYPRYDLAKFATLDTVDLDHTVKTELKVHFGKNCNSDQKFEVQGLMTETEEQHEMESRREEADTPEHYNPYAYRYRGCLEERKRGVNYGEHCWAYYDLVTTLHKYTFHVKHEKLSDRFLNRTYLLDRVLKFAFYTHSDHDELSVANPPDEVHLEANFSAKLPVADVRVRKPHANSHYYNVYLPGYVPFSSYPAFEEMHVKNSYSEVDCTVEGDRVHTFDRYEYDLPPIDCWKVIARDCSPQEHFTVLATKIKHPKYRKAVKVFLGDHKVEALPVSDDSDVIVRVDGKKVSVGEAPYLQLAGEDPLPVFYVTKRDFYYALHSEKYGLIVEYDGHGVYVQVSPYYRAKLCGLCGNYNGQRYDGSTNSEGCYYEDEKAYSYSYAIPSDTCQVPKAEPICPAEGGFGCTRLRTQVVPLATGKVPQTCFSTEPVTECAAHCKASGTVQRKVSYHCLPAKDDSTRALVREAEKRVLGELARKSRDHEDTVEVPDRCLKG